MNPEIRDLHALAPERPHNPTHEVAAGAVEKDGQIATRIDGRDGDVVGDEFVP
jgi:hypothetical protein